MYLNYYLPLLPSTSILKPQQVSEIGRSIFSIRDKRMILSPSLVFTKEYIFKNSSTRESFYMSDLERGYLVLAIDTWNENRWIMLSNLQNQEVLHITTPRPRIL
jgi:hypothetical protein